MNKNSSTSQESQPPAPSDVKMLLQLTTKVDIAPAAMPFWVSGNAFAYVSGCSIIRYDLRGPECTIMPRRPNQRSIRLLAGCVPNNGQAPTHMAYIYSTMNQSAVLVVRPIDSAKPDTKAVELPIEADCTIKCLCFLKANKYVALTETASNELNYLSIYRADRGSEVVRQEWKYNVRFLFEGILEGSLLTVDERGLSMHSYCSLAIEVDVVPPLLVKEHIYAAKICAGEMVVLVTKKEILFCWPREQKLVVQSIDLSFDILEEDVVGAAAITESLVVIALSKQRLIVVQFFSPKEISYYTKSWVDTGLMDVKVELVAVSQLCENVLMMCRDELNNQRSLEVFDYEMFGLPNRKKVEVCRLPMDCEGSLCMGIAVSCLKDETWRLTNRQVSIYPHLAVTLQHPTCITVDPFGLFVVIGFEFYFNIFAVKRQGLAMLHSIPALYSKQVSFIYRQPLIVIMFRHELRVYHSFTYEWLWEEDSLLHSEFVMFQVDQRQCRLAVLLSCGTLDIYDLVERQRISQRHLQPSIKFFEFDWQTSKVIYTVGRVIKVAFEKQCALPEEAVLPYTVSSLKLCSEMGVLFVGFEEGSIGAFKWPFESPEPIPSTISRLFEEPVACLQLSANRSYLYASSKSGNFLRMALTFFQQDKEVCKDTMISILRKHGTGFSTYYLNNITMEVLEKISTAEVEIENLEFQQQGKALCSEEQAELASHKLKQEETKRKRKFRKQRNGVLVQHRNILQCSQRQLKKLQKKLSWIEGVNSTGRVMKKHEERYARIVSQNQRLLEVLISTQKQFELEEKQAAANYAFSLEQLKEQHQQLLSKKELQFREMTVDLNHCQHIESMITEPNYHPLELELREVCRELKAAEQETEALQSKLANCKEELRRLQSNDLHFKEFHPQMIKSVEQQAAEQEAKKKEIAKLEQEHLHLQWILERQAASEKDYEHGSLQCGARIDNMLDSVDHLEFEGMRHMDQQLQTIAEQAQGLQGYLVDEAKQSKKLDDALQQTYDLRDLLRKKITDKEIAARMSRYRIKQFAGKVEQTRQELLARPKRIRYSASQDITPPSCESTQYQEKVVAQLRSRWENSRSGLHHFTHSASTSIKRHLKQNEQLIYDLNQLTVEKHNKSCALRDKANLVRSVKASLKQHQSIDSRVSSSHKKHLTPFERYHEEKAMTANVKFRRVNAPTSIRTSNSTNCSVLDIAVSSGMRTPQPSEHFPAPK